MDAARVADERRYFRRLGPMCDELGGANGTAFEQARILYPSTSPEAIASTLQEQWLWSFQATHESASLYFHTVLRS